MSFISELERLKDDIWVIKAEYLYDHADDIAELVKAAENVERYLDANRRRMPALSDALANLNKEKS